MKYVLSDWCQARPGLESTWNIISSPLSSQRLNVILLNPEPEVLCARAVFSNAFVRCHMSQTCMCNHQCVQTEFPRNPVRDLYVT